MKLVRHKNTAIEAITPARPVFTDTGKIPWTPWVIDGTFFKLLRVNDLTGGFSMLLKVDPDNESPVHGHLGAVEAFVIEGEFGYDDDRGAIGAYAYEPAGARHEPTSPGGTVMFAVVHGPLIGYDEAGNVAGVIDGAAMWELAKAGHAHMHLET
ncbi:MAG: hypothetical protein C0429_09010 [Sphingopyxis sp.]|jgi:anti-sigma factor ChrR (cupin superfamily)|nr:hypothetical protein [Sphingopyxis sp.]